MVYRDRQFQDDLLLGDIPMLPADIVERSLLRHGSEDFYGSRMTSMQASDVEDFFEDRMSWASDAEIDDIAGLLD
ncbi:MAG: hypothetical protein GC151_14935 [Betaproteobacteria bacterium]|nr:hypothetical protein [Betaproteobacteria bacterium]